MAYSGTTSTAPNTPSLVAQGMAYASSNVTGVAGLRYGLPRFWTYASTHLSSDIGDANFFGRDAQRLGFVVGDALWHIGSSAITIHMCINAGATSADFSTGIIFGATA